MKRCERAIGLLFFLCTSACSDSDSGSGSNTSSESPGVRSVGRADTSNEAALRFAWSGSGFVATVSGSAISLTLGSEGTSEPVYFQSVIDGTPGMRFAVSGAQQTISLGTGLTDGDHQVELYRETEGRYGNSVFSGFTEGTLKAPPAGPDRSIEIVGDSISAGFGNLGSEEHPSYGEDPNGGCMFSTETESAYNTYGMIAARRLGAESTVVAVSGWGAYRSNGNDTTAVLSRVYGNTLGLLATPAWSFERPADVVVINLGTNDFATGDPGETEFKTAYASLIATIREKHPDAYVFCMIGPLLYSTGLSQATTYTQAIIDERRAAGDSRIELLNFGQQNASLGTGCSWHPNVTVQTEMADRLVVAIQTALGW